jgi:hypothetical protein
VNVAAFVKFHQNKSDDETDHGPFETTQSEIKHPNRYCNSRAQKVQFPRVSETARQAGVKSFAPANSVARLANLTIYLAASLHAEFPSIAIRVVKPQSHVL